MVKISFLSHQTIFTPQPRHTFRSEFPTHPLRNSRVAPPRAPPKSPLASTSPPPEMSQSQRLQLKPTIKPNGRCFPAAPAAAGAAAGLTPPASQPPPLLLRRRRSRNPPCADGRFSLAGLGRRGRGAPGRGGRARGRPRQPPSGAVGRRQHGPRRRPHRARPRHPARLLRAVSM